MIQFEFDAQIARLRKAYGSQFVNEEFISRLWSRFGSVAPNVFEASVDHMIEERTPLKLSTIAELVNVKSRALQTVPIEASYEEKYACAICKTAGTMFAESLEGPYRLLIRCSCPIWGSEVADQELPQWSSRMVRYFRLIPLPSMKPDISMLHEDEDLAGLSDEEFALHPKVVSEIQRATHNAREWWKQQKALAVSFWPEYFAEGLSR